MWRCQRHMIILTASFTSAIVKDFLTSSMIKKWTILCIVKKRLIEYFPSEKSFERKKFHFSGPSFFSFSWNHPLCATYNCAESLVTCILHLSPRLASQKWLVWIPLAAILLTYFQTLADTFLFFKRKNWVFPTKFNTKGFLTIGLFSQKLFDLTHNWKT